MADIYLIRHGQASFGKVNYDELSDQGKEQSFKLGLQMQTQLSESLKDRQVRLVHGSLQRHRQTMDQWLSGFGKSAEFETVENTHFDEFDHENILAVAYPEFADKNVLAKHIMKSDNPRKAFHMLYEKSIQRWIAGQYDHEYAESFTGFKQRCATGFEKLVKESKSGESIFVFTSGGPIGMCVQWALGLDDKNTFQINGALVNSSVTHFLTNSNGDCTLGFLNNYSHLYQDGVEVTYR